MVDESSMPPDRAKTVHNDEQTRFVTLNANDDCQRPIQYDAGAAKLNLARAELSGQQPPKPLPHRNLSPRRHDGHGQVQTTGLVIPRSSAEMMAPTKMPPERPCWS